MGWDRPRRARRDDVRARLRDVLPPTAAVFVIALANLAFGAVQPIAVLTLSAMIAAITTAALAAAGPRGVTPSMVIATLILALAAIAGLAGPLHQSAPHLAMLFAATGLWSIGYMSARNRAALEAAWSALIWTSAAYCGWMLLASAAAGPGQMDGALASAFETPANGAILFSLLALAGSSRALHVLKQVDAEGLYGLRLFEKLTRNGLGGFLLLGLSLACLVLVGSRPGLLFGLSLLLGHAWWDTLAIATRPHRGLAMRFVVFLTPALAIALAIWGAADGWLHDETIAPGIGLSDTLPNSQRFDAYTGAWLRSPALGHGLGSIDAQAAAAQTLQNAKVMLAPGGAHNVFLSWLVEGGLVGLAIMLVALGAAHARIFRTFISTRAARTFARLAFAATALLLLHGLTDSSLNLPSVIWLYALLIGIACGLAPTGRKRSERPA